MMRPDCFQQPLPLLIQQLSLWFDSELLQSTYPFLPMGAILLMSIFGQDFCQEHLEIRFVNMMHPPYFPYCLVAQESELLRQTLHYYYAASYSVP